MAEPGAKEAQSIARSGPIDAALRLPPSKSLTQRALVAAALARGDSVIANPLRAGDTEVLARALSLLGIRVESGPGPWRIAGGGGGIPARGAALDLGDAGTAMRFLTPVVPLGRGRFLLDGSARMRERPAGDLVEALAALGVAARSVNGDGRPPLEVAAGGLPGGRVLVSGRVSSQFLSGLLLAAPCAQADLVVGVTGRLVSRPYVDLTVDVMRRFGASIEQDEPGVHKVRAGGYRACEYEVEADASSAAWWLAAAAVTGGRIRLTGLPRASLQGDLGFKDLLEEMGCSSAWEESADGDRLVMEAGSLRGIEADLADMPDVAPALAAVALFAEGPTRITGAEHLRAKESDRIAGLASGLGELGARVEEHRDGLTIHPGPPRGALLDPRNDHRLAMAFAIAGLRSPGVAVKNPTCVAKSYPDFWKTLDSITIPPKS